MTGVLRRPMVVDGALARPPALVATDGEHSRRRLMDAALRLFFANGFTETTVREITTACGLTPGAMYNHFPSKDALLMALLDESYDLFEGMLDDALTTAAPDPRSQLAALVEAFVHFHTRHRLYALVVSDEYSSLPEPRRTELLDRGRRIRQQLADVVRRGCALGVFELPTEAAAGAHLAALAIIDMVVSISAWYRPGGPFDEDALARFHAELVQRMLGAGERTD